MQTLNRQPSLRRSLLWTAAALAVTGFAPLAQAQQYPTKPITMVVPYPPGGSNDSFAR
ncbi:MAG: tripartite tricarboxylate transporter substrate binding protein, partial [Comamonas sp.]